MPERYFSTVADNNRENQVIYSAINILLLYIVLFIGLYYLQCPNILCIGINNDVVPYKYLSSLSKHLLGLVLISSTSLYTISRHTPRS